MTHSRVRSSHTRSNGDGRLLLSTPHKSKAQLCHCSRTSSPLWVGEVHNPAWIANPERSGGTRCKWCAGKLRPWHVDFLQRRSHHSIPGWGVISVWPRNCALSWLRFGSCWVRGEDRFGDRQTWNRIPTRSWNIRNLCRLGGKLDLRLGMFSIIHQNQRGCRRWCF